MNEVRHEPQTDIKPKLAGVVVAGGFPVPLSGVLLSAQLSLQGLTIMVREDTTATPIVLDHIPATATVMVVMVLPTTSLIVVVPTITALRATITTDPTGIGQSSDQVF
jgi:hypothetical protein